MFPVVIFAALAGLLSWAARPKPTGIGFAPGRALAPVETPLLPEEERLFCLLRLFFLDKRHPPGEKRYLTRPLAIEAAKVASKLGLPRTAQAIWRDDPLPEELLPGRGKTVKAAFASYL
jgi:hypothetical protein